MKRYVVINSVNGYGVTVFSTEAEAAKYIYTMGKVLEWEIREIEETRLKKCLHT